MTMTATRQPTARKRAEDRKPATRAHLAALWLEHCPTETIAALSAFPAFIVVFAFLGGTATAAYVAAALVTAPLAWWANGPASTARREARKVEAHWAKACARFGLYSFGRLGNTRFPDLSNIAVDEHRNVTADIDLPPGVWFSQLHAKQDQFEAVYARGRLRSLRIHGDDDHRTGRLTITRWVAFDRHTTEPVPYAPGRGIAVRQDGQPIHLEVGPAGANWLIAGIKGSGKSSWVNAIVAEARRQRAVLAGVDLKRVELAPWADTFDQLALDAATATQLLRDVRAEITRRVEAMQAAGIRKWRPGCGFPPLVLVVDELRQLVQDWPGDEKGEAEERAALLASIAALGRAAAVQVVAATQNPRAAFMAEIRENCDVTVCCRVRTETESFTALGDIGRRLRPDLITKAEAGVGWVVGDGEPYRARALWLDDADVQALTAR